MLTPVSPGDGVTTGDSHRRVLNHLLGQISHLLVIAIGLIGLEHRKLRAVGGISTFVAEVAVNFENAFQTAHHRALEE